MDNEILETVTENSGGTIEKIYDDGLSPSIKVLGEILGYFPRQVRIWFHNSHAQIILAEENWKSVEEEIKKKASEIPPEKLTVPESYVAIPAIEQLSYCYDSKDLRDLYANLLVSSMNVDTKANVHPAFTSIIKELCPDEAKLLNKINTFKTGFHIADFNIVNKYTSTQEIEVVFTNYSFIGDYLCDFPQNTPTYIDNLCRLGLIFTRTDADDMDEYWKILVAEAEVPLKKLCRTPEEYESFHFTPKLGELTNFGKQFIKTCVAPPSTRKVQESG